MAETFDPQAGESGVSQAILDALTEVKMPRLRPRPAGHAWTRAHGWNIPVRRAGVVVVGSGAAGLRAAVELKRFFKEDELFVF